MSTDFNDFVLDEDNYEFKRAAEYINKTRKIVFLTGKAGTGKTTFLKYIKANTKKNVVVVSPTGVAAVNAGGMTISSFFQIPFGPLPPKDKRLRVNSYGDADDTTIYSTFRYFEDKKGIIKGLELLIIDEISMVRCDTIDVIDRILRVFRNNPYEPFGGVQVLFIGDVFQLPPIANEKNNEWGILSQFYRSKFFFSSIVMVDLISKNEYKHFELKKIYRQKDQLFIDLLNRIRLNEVTNTDMQTLERKSLQGLNFSSGVNDKYITLTVYNSQADKTNSVKLHQLEGDDVTCKGEVTGEFPKDSIGEFVLPTKIDLKLKVGAQVMFLKNDAGEHKQYYNGKIGIVKAFKVDAISIELPNGTCVNLGRARWENVTYTWDKKSRKIKEVVIGSFVQYPLKLAWAITVHKSQGMTFDRVVADVGSSFDDGQVYVALSRCTTFDGLVLQSQIPRSAIRTNEHALEFSKNQEFTSSSDEQSLNDAIADSHYSKAIEFFKEGKLSKAVDSFNAAVCIRNDIKTEIFKRYIVVIFTRLLGYKKEYLTIYKETERIREVVVTQRKVISELTFENECLKFNNADNQIELDKIKADIVLVKSALQFANNTIEQQKSLIETMKVKIDLQDRDMAQLKEKKWYEKIFK